MPRVSAGILLYRQRDQQLEVLLVHPGGPFFRAKDAGAWTIPKGEPNQNEELLAAAVREFAEEIGFAPEGPFVELGAIRQKGGKEVHAWAASGDCDPTAIRSNTFSIEWPTKSGQFRSFPEIDRAGFFTLDEARQKINPAQAALLDALESHLHLRKGA
jgi:predicted NUDIX family NTP pyrophosphohydrolase